MKFLQSSLLGLFLSLFSSCATSYRILEYNGKQCNSEQLNVHRLAGPSPCEKLSSGNAQSALVKIDNIHDNQYDVVLYSSETCDGQVIGLIHNANGCLPVDVPGFGTAKSVRVVPTSSQAANYRRTDADSDPELNMGSIEPGIIRSPIAPGVFVNINTKDHDEYGFFHSERAAEYNAPDPNESQVESKLLAVENGTAVPLDLRYQYCAFTTKCLAVFSPLAQVIPAVWIDFLASRIWNIPWSSLHEGASVFIGTFNTGASAVTWYTSFKSSGTQKKDCDTTYATGAVVKDSLHSQLDAGRQFTDVVMEFCATNQECFAFAAYLFTETNMRQGTCQDP